MATELGLNARLMKRDEIHVLVDYFHDSSSEHLETLGVDPTRLPRRESWHQRMLQEFTLPLYQRASVLVAWLLREHLSASPRQIESCSAIERTCICM